MNTIQINDKEYKIKNTIRSLFIFEQITGKSFEIKTLLDNYVYFYSILLACNEDVLTWDDFIEALDNDPTIIQRMNDAVVEQQKLTKVFNQEDENGDVKKN